MAAGVAAAWETTVAAAAADDCDTDKVASCAGRRNVTFGNDWRDTMQGMWPIKVKDHGGPAELGIQRRGECDGDGACDGDQTGMTSGLLKINKGIKRTT